MNQAVANVDPLTSIVPYKNGKALGSYYSGVFSIIPGIGIVLGPLAIILGVGGRDYAKKNPSAKGGGHAMTGIILGSIGSLFSYGGAIAIAIGVLAN